MASEATFPIPSIGQIALQQFVCSRTFLLLKVSKLLLPQMSKLAFMLIMLVRQTVKLQDSLMVCGVYAKIRENFGIPIGMKVLHVETLCNVKIHPNLIQLKM